MKLQRLIICVAILSAMYISHAVELRIYGGSDHSTFLGVLNGSKFESDSIWNNYGTYGSKYNSESIWNKYGLYGGSYSGTSPFSKFASNPPVIVDKEGNFYGYLTVNEHHKKRAEFRLALIVCSMWESACDDLEPVYEIAKNHFNPQFKTSAEGNTSTASNKGRQTASKKTIVITMRNATTILEGCKLFSSDGKYLGTITWNDVASDSIFNSIGRYGSDISSTSIWNDISEYGSDISPNSAFNDIASDPPRIVKEGKFIGYLTANDTKAHAVHPKFLLAFLNDGFDKMYRKRLMGVE